MNGLKPTKLKLAEDITFLTKVIVMSDSREEIIDKTFLVPGDIVLLEAGDNVPADLRILGLSNFLVDESENRALSY